MEKSTRINKYLKDKGLATRRGADALIESGAVFINGKKAILGSQVYKGDNVEIKSNAKTKMQMLYYFAYNKPVGVLTNKDEEGLKGKGAPDILTVTKFVPKNGKMTKVFPVGRLDKDSSGLLIVTNDGRITDKLLSPRFKHEKEYVVTLSHPYNDFFLSRMRNGVRIDGSITRKCTVERFSPDTFKIILTEGKKRQIRRMCEALHQSVVALERVRIMNITLGNLEQGEYHEIEGEERKSLLKSLYIEDIGAMNKAYKKPNPRQSVAVPIVVPAPIEPERSSPRLLKGRVDSKHRPRVSRVPAPRSSNSHPTSLRRQTK